jgi:hypothetical protein
MIAICLGPKTHSEMVLIAKRAFNQMLLYVTILIRNHLYRPDYEETVDTALNGPIPSTATRMPLFTCGGGSRKHMRRQAVVAGDAQRGRELLRYAVVHHKRS